MQKHTSLIPDVESGLKSWTSVKLIPLHPVGGSAV